MTIVIRRRVGLLTMVAASTALLAACGSGPNLAGSAAIVGNTAISLDQVQQQLNSLLSQPTVQKAQQQGQLDQVARGILTDRITHELTTLAEQKYGINVTDQQVDQVVSQSGGADQLAGQLIARPSDVHGLIKDKLIESQLARKYADTLSVSFDYVSANGRADALSKVKKIAADPSSIGGLVKAQQATQSQSGQSVPAGLNVHYSMSQYFQQVAQYLQQSGQSQGSPSQPTPFFGVQPNTVLAFQASAQDPNTWLVMLVHSRTIGAAPAGTSAAQGVDLQTLVTAGESLLQPVEKQLNVQISPRYGSWDLADMRVAADNDQTAGVELPVRGVRG